MAEITLKAYLAHVDDLLGQRQYEEAEAHCKHILAKYPKNLAALRRLAKAELEAGRYAEAENTYATVLSLEPRSADAYVGLSWVARQRGQGDQTIALLERAYEQDTNNQDVVQLLRDAHRTFNDRSNVKLPQTQYVAARQQWRSGLDQQAISTLNATLAADPARADVRLLKAQILMQMGDGVEAARAVTAVLQQLPECVEANRMLAEFWKSQGRSSDAQRFVRHVEAADPFLAFEVATGAPPPDDALMLSLLNYRSTSGVASVASDTPEWLGELGMTDLGEPTPTQRSTPPVTQAGELDWLDQSAEEAPEVADSGWLKEAASGSSMPDDLSWLTEAASEDVNFDQLDELADFAAAFSGGAGEDASMDMDWMDNDRADEGETMPSVSTRMVEEEIANEDNLREFSQMSEAEVSAEPGEVVEEADQRDKDWMSTIETASNDVTLPERQDFDEFLKNYTSFSELTPETEQSSGTGLTGLLSSLTTPEEQVSPDVADIDPADPLAWMRDAALRDGLEQDMPDLGALLGEDMLDQSDDAPVLTEDPSSPSQEAAPQPSEYAMPSVPDADNPFAWMQEHDIEMVDEAREPSLWDDPLGVENMQTIDQAEVDPLAWMKQAGIAPEDEIAAPTAAGADDLGDPPDPFAWAKESGLDLVDDAQTANYVQTSALTGEAANVAANEERSSIDESSVKHQPPIGASGLLAFIKDGDTVQQGDGPMNDKDLPDWLGEPDQEGEPAKKDESSESAEFDWMAVAPADADADAEIDWDAAPEEPLTDEAPPDWLASLENPGDSADAVGLSAQDNPNDTNIWESAVDDEPDAEMPEWMAALRDEPAVEEAASDAADWVFSEGEAAQDEVAAAQEDLLVSASQAHDAALDAVSEIAEAEGDAMDWLGAAAPAEPAIEGSGDSEDMDWLNAAVSTGDLPSEAAEIADAGADLGLEWLSTADTGEVSDEAAVQDAVSAGEDMDWLKEAAPDAAVDEVLESDASPLDWMADVAKADEPEAALESASDFVLGEFESDEYEAQPGAELAAAEADFLSELNAADRPVSLGDSDEPAFELSFIEEDAPTEDVATVELEGDPLPDWMVEMKPEGQPLKMDVDVPEEQLSVAGGLAGEILDDADLLEAEPPIQESLTASAVNSPDWLNAMVPGLEVGTDLPDDDEDDGSESEFMNGGRSDFAWLGAIVDEELAPPAVAAPSRRLARFPFSEPPLWLALLRDETQATTPVLDADNDDDSLPDWLKFDDAETN